MMQLIMLHHQLRNTAVKSAPPAAVKDSVPNIIGSKKEVAKQKYTSCRNGMKKNMMKQKWKRNQPLLSTRHNTGCSIQNLW